VQLRPVPKPSEFQKWSPAQTPAADASTDGEKFMIVKSGLFLACMQSVCVDTEIQRSYYHVYYVFQAFNLPNAWIPVDIRPRRLHILRQVQEGLSSPMPAAGNCASCSDSIQNTKTYE